MKIYVGNLSFNTTEADLTAAFGQYGQVDEAAVVSDRETGKSRGFGFVEMSNDQAARDAIKALDGAELGGRQLKVNEARPRENRSQGRSQRRW